MKLAQREQVQYWSIPHDLFGGDTVLILGGGPSLARYDVSRADAYIRFIAINNAFLRAPRADMLYFADENWYKWNRDLLRHFEGDHIVTRSYIRKEHQRKNHKPLNFVNRHWGEFSEDNSMVAGFDGGSNAINLAWLGGASRILLLGFDMRPGNWHGDHKFDTPDTHYENFFKPSIGNIAKAIEAKGNCQVINITPGSALGCFEYQSPERFGITRLDR